MGNIAGRKQLSILLAEDNETNILLVSTILKKLGHTVTAVRNGIEALEAVKKNNFNLILMDIEMPGIDGIEAAKKIRSGECGIDKSNICIIAMSGHAVADIKQNGIDAGMNDFITKPLDITTIQERIDKVMGL
jgi:CheY-like chemotaxis protein